MPGMSGWYWNLLCGHDCSHRSLEAIWKRNSVTNAARHDPQDQFCRYCGCFLGAGASDKRTSSIYAPPKIAKSEALKIAEADQLEALKKKMSQQKAKLEQDSQSDDKEIQLESEYQPVSPDTKQIQKAINSAATLFVLSKMF